MTYLNYELLTSFTQVWETCMFYQRGGCEIPADGLDLCDGGEME